MGDSTKITLGPVNAGWKAYVAGSYVTGFTDFGLLTDKGAKFKYKGKELEVPCGNKLGIIKRLLTGETGDLEINLLETTVENFATAFGIDAGDIEDDAVNHYKYIYIGGQTANNEFSAKITSVLEDGSTLTLTLYRCHLAREQKITFGPDKVIENPVHFKALGDSNSGTLNLLGDLSIVPA